ncbi:MAG: dTDP-4-dehydrorhamnose 3,5-epimerase [Elusimicrobiota bacterium]|jgi:dTDP-4-dehydrorhamnose 3,5-epimerase
MKFQTTSIPGVVLVELDVFKDPRGFFMESYQREKYRAGGIAVDFVQDNHAASTKGVLRGLHLQLEHMQGKLVRVVEGKVWDVAVDVRRGSPWFGQWEAFELSAENFRQLYIPPGFAHGYCVLSERAQVEYKASDLYHPASDVSIRWNDPQLAVRWPIQDPVLSKKDAEGKTLEALSNRLPSYY